jgi:hypothetical protein
MAVKKVDTMVPQAGAVRSCIAALAAPLLILQAEGGTIVMYESGNVLTPTMMTSMVDQMMWTLMICATILGALAFVGLGALAGWFAHAWACTSTTVITKTVTSTTATHSIGVQSPVTYLRNRATPRFHPLPENDHGACL